MPRRASPANAPCPPQLFNEFMARAVGSEEQRREQAAYDWWESLTPTNRFAIFLGLKERTAPEGQQ